MFTVEHNFDNSLIVVIDQEGDYEDLLACVYEDIVLIYQWCDIMDDYNIITVSPKMFDHFIKSYFVTEGMYT